MRKEKKRRISMIKVMILILFIWNSALTFTFMNKEEPKENEEVMEKADQALYYSKKNGKNMFMYYDNLPEEYLKSLEEENN